MTLTHPATMLIPQVIADTGIQHTPLNFLWDITVSRAMLYPLDDEHRSLQQAFYAVNPRAALALTMATGEWVAWRAQAAIDPADLLARLQAGYAAAIDLRYARVPEPDEPFPDTLQEWHGAVKLARMLVTQALGYAQRHSSTVSGSGVAMALLARHVCPDVPAFEKWLSMALRRAALQWPAKERNPDAWPPVWRHALFRDASVPDDVARQAFLAELDPARNRYLRTAADMAADGFVGAPYGG